MKCVFICWKLSFSTGWYHWKLSGQQWGLGTLCSEHIVYVSDNGEYSISNEHLWRELVLYDYTCLYMDYIVFTICIKSNSITKSTVIYDRSQFTTNPRDFITISAECDSISYFHSSQYIRMHITHTKHNSGVLKRRVCSLFSAIYIDCAYGL